MKTLIATLVTLIFLSIAVVPAGAQTRTRSRSYNSGQSARYNNRVYDNRSYANRAYDQYPNDVYRNDSSNYPYNQNRSIWDKSRDKITTAGGAVGGAVLGGLIGGKKGAIIGAITGGAGAAIYTYKVRDKYGRY